jgi:DNA polymerase-3 subunit beta
VKVSVEPSLFADLVGRAARHTAPNDPEPVFGGILLEAADDRLTVSAQTRDTSLKASMLGDVAEPGRALLPGKVLEAAAKSLAKSRDMLQLAATPAETTITCGSSVMTIRNKVADEFPELPGVAAPIGTVDAGDMRDAVTQVAPACKPDKPVRPEHTVVRIDVDGDEITWVGADNYRLAARVTPWNPAVYGTKLAAHLPVRVISTVARDFAKGPVTLGVEPNLVTMSSAEQVVTVRQFQIPDYTDFKPRLAHPLPTTVTVDTEALLDTVKRVTLFADQNVGVHLDIGPEAIGVHAGDIANIGRGADTVPCELDGDAMTLRFQPAYLLDGLEGVHTERLALNLSAPGRYILIQSADQAFQYLAVPLKPR